MSSTKGESSGIIRFSRAGTIRYSIASSPVSGGFLLPIPIDRAAFSYHLLDLSVVVLFLGWLFSFGDVLFFEVRALAPISIDKCRSPCPAHLVVAANSAALRR